VEDSNIDGAEVVEEVDGVEGGGVGLDVGDSLKSTGAEVVEEVGDIEGDGVGLDVGDSVISTRAEGVIMTA
jgi:hypothetical protein